MFPTFKLTMPFKLLSKKIAIASTDSVFVLSMSSWGARKILLSRFFPLRGS